MCIICTNNYDINITYLDCDSCKKIKKLPQNLYKLKYLNIKNTNITELSPYYLKLIFLNISNTSVTKLYNYSKLKKLLCNTSNIKY